MSRRRRHEEHENHERWLVSYADFITLLFAFFVVMYATSTNNEEKQKSFEESVRANLKLGFVSQSSGQGSANNNGELVVPELINPIDGFPRRGGPTEVQDYVARQIDKNLTKEEKEQAIVKVHHDVMGARISLAASSFFPSGQTKIKMSSLKILGRLAEILKNTDRRIVIEGHTDDRPIDSPEFASNWELASLRATSVVRYLIKYQGVPASRLAAISYADQKPLVPNDSDENRAKNRRIEILILGEEQN